MQIVLMRHGKPDMPHYPGLKAYEMERWIETYNQAGLSADSHPQASAIALAGQSNVIVTSDLRRSIDSALKFGVCRLVLTDGIFREADLPYSSGSFLKLPASVWAAYFRVLWLLGYSNHCESLRLFRTRVAEAASRLVELARQHESVLFVGHGIMNQFIVRELLSSGWVSSATNARRYWEPIRCYKESE